MPIEATQSVDEVMRRWPQTMRVFIKHGMHCIGCPIACFHTVEDACREHAVNLSRFLADLRDAAGARDSEAAIAARWPSG